MNLKFSTYISIHFFNVVCIFYSCNGINPNKESKLTAKELYSRIIDNIVQIQTMNGLGTGFIIGDNQVITNFHVLKGENQAKIFMNGVLDPINVNGYTSLDQTNDLILLNTKCKNKVNIEIEDSFPVPGDKVFVIGSPLGFKNTISEGIVSGIRTMGNKRLIQITSSISPGSSGSPVFNERGKLVGVAVSGIEGANDIYFCIPALYVKSLMMFKTPELHKLNDLLLDSNRRIAINSRKKNRINESNSTTNKNEIILDKRNKAVDEANNYLNSWVGTQYLSLTEEFPLTGKTKYHNVYLNVLVEIKKVPDGIRIKKLRLYNRINENYDVYIDGIVNFNLKWLNSKFYENFVFEGNLGVNNPNGDYIYPLMPYTCFKCGCAYYGNKEICNELHLGAWKEEYLYRYNINISHIPIPLGLNIYDD